MLESEALLYLDDYVKQGDVTSFLRRYLDYSLQGRNFGVPKHVGQQGLDEWQVFVSQVSTHKSDEFLAELSKLWDNVVAETGSEPSDQHIRQYVNVLDNKPLDFPAAPHEKLPPGYIIPDTKVSETIKEHVQLPETSISDLHYLGEKIASEADEMDSLKGNVKQALSKKDAVRSIALLLQLRVGEPKTRLPKSSGVGKIKKEWQDIASKDYDVSASEKFLDALTAEWHKLVLLYSIPITPEDYQQLLVNYISDSKLG